MENQLTLSNAIGEPRRSNTSAIQEEHHAEFTPSDDNATFKPGIIMNHIQDGPNNDFVYQSFVDNNETSEMDYGIIAAEIRNNNQEDTDLQLETTSIDDDVHYDSEDNQINRIYDAPMISEEGSFAIVTTEDQLDIR